MQKKQRIIISVINDLVTDQRVHKVSTSLIKNGYMVTLVGRKLKYSQPIQRQYKTKRMRLLFVRGPLFYACFNFRLFLYLLFVKADIFLANDLDTLWANFLVAKIRRKKLVYDSHEYFTEVPELINRNFSRNTWLKIEKRILPKLKNCYTVCQSIADEYNKKYNINMQVIMNLPVYKELVPQAKENQPVKIIIYQGAVNKGRGLEQIICAMQFIENAEFHIYGEGDIYSDIQELIEEVKVGSKVKLMGRFPFEELQDITKLADLGVSLEQNMGLNYYYSLPNKLFDYIQAQIPVLCSEFPEMKNVIDKYKIGQTINNFDPENLSKTISEILNNPVLLNTWKENLKIAAKELNWEKQENKLLLLFNR
ncbi:MAG: glycosyltransferase [Bacteroidota bacterium]